MAGAAEVKLRRASAADVPYLVELAADPLVEPYLAPGSGEAEHLEAVLSEADSQAGPGGLFVIESESGERLGGVALQLFSERSRLCNLTRLMVSPQARGTGVGTEAVRLACRHAFSEHGYHRVQAETYGDNRAAQRLFERVGFVREGVRRSAYWRREQWLDGVLYGVLSEELR